jgi:hypothetical protein
MRSSLKILCAALLGAGVIPSVSAQTDGSVTFNVQLSDNSGTYHPKHVVAVWVTTSANAFIKTVWKNGTGFSGEGTSHLTQW